ncbi:MAG: aminotransferase class III-fold pyridoxal phosphate-dependent enzyme [Planctomycetota bacterium]
MLTVRRPLVHESQSDTWIGPAPWIVTPPPGPKTIWATSHHRRLKLTSAERPYPLVIQRAQGTIVEDIDGNRYLDFNAGSAVCSTGHCHPRVVRAIEEQASKLIHTGSDNSCCEATIRLTEKLARMAPGRQAKQVLLTNGGTESVEAAIKLALHFKQRMIILAFDGASHNNIIDSMSIGASTARRKRDPALARPVVKYMPYGDMTAVTKLFDKQMVAANQVAAIFVEPLLGGGTCIVPPAEFLPQLRSLCDEHGILLVIDETRIGMGRTGTVFCCEQLEVDPDMVLLASGLAGGMPLGALMARELIMRCRRDLPALSIAVNPISCAAALATIGVLEKHMIKHVHELSSIAMDKLVRMANRHKFMVSPRGMGLMLAVDIVKGQRLRIPTPKLRDRIVREAFSRGLLLAGCGKSSIRLTPPLCINRVQMEVGLDVFEEAVDTVSI